MPLPGHKPKRNYTRRPKYESVNFLRIPYLAQKKIVAQIGVLDSIHFSLNCEQYRQVLLKAKVKSDTLRYQFLSPRPKLLIEDPGTYITVQMSAFCGGIRKKEQPIYRLSGVRTDLEIHRLRGVTNTFQLTLKVKDYREDTALDALKLFTYHLLEFLIPSRVEVSYNRPFILTNVLHWNHVPKYHQIVIGHDNAIEGITEQEKHFLLEKVKMKHLAFKYNNCAAFLVPSLRRWLSDDQIEYQVDQVSFYTVMGQGEFLNICNALNAEPTGFTEEDIISRQPLDAENCIRGTQRDINRESDGKTVTIVLYRSTITLLFWNQETLRAAGRL